VFRDLGSNVGTERASEDFEPTGADTRGVRGGDVLIRAVWTPTQVGRLGVGKILVVDVARAGCSCWKTNQHFEMLQFRCCVMLGAAELAIFCSRRLFADELRCFSN
jgi:hypothetical protein